MKPKKELVRVVKSPEGEIALDLTGRRAGRGAYVCPARACLAAARKAHRLEKAFACAIPDAHAAASALGMKECGDMFAVLGTSGCFMLLGDHSVVVPGTCGIVKDGILKKLKSIPKAMEILQDLQTSYNESLMFDIMNLDKEQMIEAILADDTYILLEELTKWSNKNVYINTLNTVFDELTDIEVGIIKQILESDFDYLDKVFKKEKKLIIKFLGLMNPTESFARKTDVALLEYMTELGDLYKKYNK